MKLKDEKLTDNLEGQLLIAMPQMTDERFHRSVIYMCAHSPEGAMGIIINQKAPNIDFKSLLERLEISEIHLSNEEDKDIEMPQVHLGGPVETRRGFVLHSADYYNDENTITIDGEICLTATLDILKAMAWGKGPDDALLALGYAGWGPGQLEEEMQTNGWLHCSADRDLIFMSQIDQKYRLSMGKIGIDPSHLVNQTGHA